MKDKDRSMLIANPIYDVVFKYMLEDDKVARLFLSALLGKEVLELVFMPQEMVAERRGKPSLRSSFAHGLSIYRLDFSAKVRMPNGAEELLIIELQKSKLRTTTGRFRNYLGKQYMKPNLLRWIANNQPRDYGAGIPIFPIFILGEGLDEYEGVPVIRISNRISDHHSGSELEKNSVFISSLFHEGLIVNVPALKSRRRNDLERVLSVFDQSRVDETTHIMNIREEDFEERYHPIIRRLQKAAGSDSMRARMDGEDEILTELSDYEHDMAEANRLVEEAQQRAAEERRQKEEAQQREKSLQAMMAKMLYGQGKSVEEIAATLSFSSNYVQKLLADE